MARKAPVLKELIDVRPEFQRSVHLVRDLNEGGPAGASYIVTPTGVRALRLILEGLRSEGHCRALTLTGPYGVGKSAFALFLCRLLSGTLADRKDALEKVRGIDPDLAHDFSRLVRPGHVEKMLTVPITARPCPASKCLLEGAYETVKKIKHRSPFSGLLRMFPGILEDPVTDSRRVVAVLEQLQTAARSAGYTGVLFIVDEFGKLFEYAARGAPDGDVFVLQEVAEFASRSGATPFLFIGILHQSFEEYARSLDPVTREEWTKIQGRFTDFAFLEPTEQMMRLLAAAIHRQKTGLPPPVESRIRKVARHALTCGIKPRAMSDKTFLEVACRCYPLHPLTLVALPIVMQRFAQNERSLFTFLNSLEPHGFQEFLQTHHLNPTTPPFIRLPDLFDYVLANLGSVLYRHPHGRRWMEAWDALERQNDLTEPHAQVLKTIGVLGSLSRFSHLRASGNMLAFALEDAHELSDELAALVADLTARSVLAFRRFNDTYRIWEGSDVDIEERMDEARRKVRSMSLAEILRGYTDNRPFVARRHSFQTGAIRFFEVVYVGRPEEIPPLLESPTQADGRVIVCLPSGKPEYDAFLEQTRVFKNCSNILFAIPRSIGSLYAVAVEAAALRWVRENTPELRDDRVARHELSLRLTETERLLKCRLTILLDPRPEPEGSECTWIWEGSPQEVRSRKDVTQLLSAVCDKLYAQTPRIRNELIIRRSLSSAAAGARRALVEAMLLHSDQPTLGIEGYPPERSMYESVLRATGIHRQDAEGRWGLFPPTEEDPRNLRPAWNLIEKTIFERPEPVPVSELYQLLGAPPYGVLPGLAPILLCAFFLAHQEETTLYREGTFVPDPSPPDFEILLRRPDLFSIGGVRLQGVRRRIVERLSQGLGVPASVPSVVRALFAMVRRLPEYAWKTKDLPANIADLREAFANARSPEQFLFHELPLIFGLPSFVKHAPSPDQVEHFFQELNSALQTWARALPKAVEKARDILLEACGLPGGPVGWRQLRLDCEQLQPLVVDPQLLLFMQRVIEAPDNFEGMKSVLGLVAKCLPEHWKDFDIERFPGTVSLIGRAFRAAKKRANEEGILHPGLSSLTANEQIIARTLLDNLRQQLRTTEASVPEHVVRAVLIELARGLPASEKVSET